MNVHLKKKNFYLLLDPSDCFLCQKFVKEHEKTILLFFEKLSKIVTPFIIEPKSWNDSVQPCFSLLLLKSFRDLLCPHLVSPLLQLRAYHFFFTLIFVIMISTVARNYASEYQYSCFVNASWEPIYLTKGISFFRAGQILTGLLKIYADCQKIIF